MALFFATLYKSKHIYEDQHTIQDQEEIAFYASPKTVKELAEDLGIHENLLYNWRRKYPSDGDKTKYATLEEENRALRRELAETRLERDMLKKAAGYFASHQK